MVFDPAPDRKPGTGNYETIRLPYQYGPRSGGRRKALVEALRHGRISGAGLDVYENEPELSPGLANLKMPVLLPHIGSATIETRTKMALMAAENLLAGLRGERPPELPELGISEPVIGQA